MATVEAVAYARRLHDQAREAHREEARQRRASHRYYDELKAWCRTNGIRVEEYDPRIFRTEATGHGPGDNETG